MSKGVITADTPVGSLSGSSDWGNGVLLGVGYGIPVSSESRLIIGFSYTNKTIEDEKYNAAMFTVGGLW